MHRMRSHHSLALQTFCLNFSESLLKTDRVHPNLAEEMSKMYSKLADTVLPQLQLGLSGLSLIL